MRKKTVQTSSTKSSTKGNVKSNTKSNTKSNARNSVKSSVKSSAKNSPQKAVKTVAPTVENVSVKQAVIIQEPSVEQNEQNIPTKQPDLGPRRSVAFIGSECYPFVKTGGLGDVMSALPKSLAKLNIDVKVIIPRYKCIPQKFQEKMEYRGSFDMNLCSDGKQYYVGIMEYQEDGVVYDFIDNDEFFSWGNPYTNLIDDIPKFCYFSKAALAALNYLNWTPDIVHCHDWQAALVPLYLRTSFKDTNVGRAGAVLTIHNLRFQGIYDRKTIQYWSALPDYVFNKDCMTQNWLDANMLKGGITYCNKLTTITLPASLTYITGSALTRLSRLTEVKVADGNNSFKFENGILLSKDGKTMYMALLTLTEINVSNGVVSILGDSLIGSNATKIILPDTVSSNFGGAVFNGMNKLTTIELSGTSKNLKLVDGNLYSYDGKRFIKYMGSSKNFTVPEGVETVVSEAVRDHLAEKGFDENYGARPLRRVIQNEIEDVLADKILEGTLTNGQTMTIGKKDKKLTFSVKEN